MRVKSSASRDGIEAASRTYLRCTEVLRREFGVEPADAGLGPRNTFEETVTSLRALLAHTGNPEAELTEEDFSSNDVLRLMRLTAAQLGKRGKRRIERDEFIRHVNNTLQETGGLKPVQRWHPRTERGRYGWINGHMAIFLRRNSDVAQRSTAYPQKLWIGHLST